MISTPGSLPGTTKSGFAGDSEIPRSTMPVATSHSFALLLAIITSASWLGSACSRTMSSLTVIAITPDGRPCKPVVRNRRLDLHLIEKRPSSTKSNVKVQACLVNFRDVSRIIPPAQTWCAVPPLAQASANPRQGAPKPPYPEGSWPSPPADGTPRLPYGTSPRRFGRMVSSAVPLPLHLHGNGVVCGNSNELSRETRRAIGRSKEDTRNYYCCGSANTLCAKFDRAAPRVYFAESMFSRVSRSSCLTSAFDAPLQRPWLEPGRSRVYLPSGSMSTRPAFAAALRSPIVYVRERYVCFWLL
jgi:hypothetical protein